MAQTEAEFLALDNVTLRRGDTAVFRRTSWTWHRGEQWAMVGPNGSGKSLLVHALLGHAPLARGEVRGPFGATDSTEAPPENPIVVVSPQTQRELVLQESSFYQSRWHSGLQEGQRTVAQFLSQESVEDINPYEVKPRRGNRHAFLRSRAQYLRWLDIRHLWRRKIIHLSNGELRKTLLVHALLRMPRLLVLDDPYAGLDPGARRRLHRVIVRLMRAGQPVLIVTHRLDEIPETTTHLILVEGHRVVAQDKKSLVFKQAQARFGTRTPVGHTQPSSGRASFTRAPNRTRRASLVELHNVTVRALRRTILCDVNWTIRPGENWCLLGPNGAGKTTLLNLIQGDHPQAYSQDVRLFGERTDSTQAIWQARQFIGWFSPELLLHYPPEWRTLDVVCSGFFNSLGLYQACSRRQILAARQWLRDFGLALQEQRPFGELSAGHQRLALLARAAVKVPRLLILDEPCQVLDASLRLTVLATVDRIVEQTGASLIFVTHRAGEIPRCITHVFRLRNGRCLSAGPAPDEMTDDLRRNQGLSGRDSTAAAGSGVMRPRAR